MKVKAYWKSLNPFRPDGDLVYSKTINVPDGSCMEELKEFAMEDSREGYHFYAIEELK